ncbi:hypothetical protein H2200_008905 [Cladophialophora chaetospira]|uniref:BTB domain-containing protein n=1 Tax=Cladophialophora chaetospira TaxID=386627 RepID=A0AA39CG49_9EURO|nr:hypothetical protein H2200_008905 [Cladophialophora chaetospira]
MARANYLQLLGAGLEPDATLVGDGVEFPVHRQIVCPQSGYLRAALNGNWLESSANRVELREIDLDTTRKIIHFLYEGVYVTNLGADFLPDERLSRSFERDLRAYQSADYLMIGSLKDAILEAMVAFVYANRNLHAEVVARNLNMMYEGTHPNDRDLRCRFTKIYVERLVRATPDAYAANGVVVNAIASHEPELWTRIENMTEKLAAISTPRANLLRHVGAFLDQWQSARWYGKPCRILITDMKTKSKNSFCKGNDCGTSRQYKLKTDIDPEGGVRANVWCTNCQHSTSISTPESLPVVQRAFSGLVIDGCHKRKSIFGCPEFESQGFPSVWAG